jgi:SM-20-related protein
VLPGCLPHLDSEAVAKLGRGEPLIFDGVLGTLASADVIAVLTADLRALRPAAIGHAGTPAPEVRGDSTRWLDAASMRSVAALSELFAHIGRELRENAWLGRLETEIQLAFHPGNGALYQRHRDAFVGRGRRRATAIYYMNASWVAEDHGELRIYTADREIDIEPIADRLVIFLADEVEHAVLACRAPRWAATAWYLGPGIVN